MNKNQLIERMRELCPIINTGNLNHNEYLVSATHIILIERVNFQTYKATVGTIHAFFDIYEAGGTANRLQYRKTIQVVPTGDDVSGYSINSNDTQEIGRLVMQTARAIYTGVGGTATFSYRQMPIQQAIDLGFVWLPGDM